MSTTKQIDFGNKFNIISDQKVYEERRSRLEFYVTGMAEIHVHMESGSKYNSAPYGQSMLISADDAWDLMEWLEANLEPAKARTRRSEY